MLILTRRVGETLVVGDDVTVTLSYKMKPIMPLAELVVNGPIDIKVDSTIRVE